MSDLPRHMIDRIRSLREERGKLVALSPEEAMDHILEALHPAALVHSMPEEDFYFLIHDIGPEDALPLLSLASDTQLEYILDIEGWHRDRIQLPTLTQWMDRMMRAQPQRFVSWLIDHHTEFSMYYFNRNLEILIREHDRDPSDFGDDFFTLDDVVYVRILPSRPLSDDEEKEGGLSADEKEDQRTEFLRKFIDRAAENDHEWYQQLMINTGGVLPAEAEEELYRLRNVRLAEKGFLPFEEAIGVYQPLRPEDLIGRPAKAFGNAIDTAQPPSVPQYPIGLLGPQTPFSEALARIDSEAKREHLQIEFASLCNRVISADQKQIQERVQLREIVRKVCGYISLGLETLAAAGGSPTPENIPTQWAAFVTRFPLSHIFQVGYGCCLRLKWLVQGWQKKAWFTNAGLPLTFWGETWMGIIGGLLIPKPLFFDNYQSENMYREFASAADIAITEAAIKQIMAMDEVMSRLHIRLRRHLNTLLTYKNLLLTLWARHHLALSEKSPSELGLTPLTRNEFSRFFQDLFGVGSTSPPGIPRKIGNTMKAAFLSWIADRSGETAAALAERLGPSLDALFDEIDAELGAVRPEDLDPRFVFLFWVQ